MKRLIALGIFSLLIGAAQAQEIEATAAYQFNRFEAESFGISGSTTFPAGASANVNVPINRWVGITGDVSWTQKSLSSSGISATARLFTFGAGPQFTYRKDPKFQPFFRIIFGAGTANGSVTDFGSATSTAFMFGPGGGLDMRVMRHVWVRAGVDYLHSDKEGVSVNGLRAIAGIQFRFGGKTPDVAADSQPPRSIPSRSVSSRSTTTLSASHSAIPISALGLSASSQKDGAEVEQVLSGSVASHSGLQAGDVINFVDGKRITSSEELAAAVSARKPGDTIEIGYLVRGMWQAKASLIIPVP